MTPPAMAVQNRTVGDVLLDHGTISESQLDQALARQKVTGQPIGQILVESGAITRLDLASALAEQWSDAPHLVQAEPGKAPSAVTYASLTEALPFAAPTGGGDQSVGELRSFVQLFAARLDAVEARTGGVELLHDRLGELRQMVTGLADWAAGPELRIAELDAHQGEIRSELGAVSGRLDQLISGLEGAITGIEEYSGDLADRVDTLTAQIDTEALAELRALVESLVARPAVDPATVEALAARVDEAATAAQLEEVRALVDELASRPPVDPALAKQVAAFAARLEEIDSRTAALSDVDVSAGIAEATAGIGERLAAVEAGARRSAERLDAAAPAEAVEELRAEVGALGARIEEVASAPAIDELRTVTDELRVAVDGLAARPAVDPETAERLELLSARLDATSAATELEELRTLVGELAGGRGVATERVEALAEKVSELSARLDGLAVSADGKVDVNVVGELREALEVIAARPAGDPALAARVDALAGRVEDAVALGDLVELASVVEALSSRLDDGVDLAARVEQLEARPEGDAELAGRVEQLAARLDALAVPGDGSVDVSVVTELRARIEELAARPIADGAVADDLVTLRSTVDELVTRAAAGAGLAEDVAALRLELVALGAADTGAVEALSARLERVERQAVTAAVPGLDGDDIARLSGRIEELAARIEAVAVEAGAVVVTGEGSAPAPVGEIDKLRVSVESLWMRMSEFQRSVAALLDPRGISGKLETIEARLELLETRGPAVGAAATAGQGSGDLHAIARRIEEMESASSSARETLLTSLERMASSIDWRLQRLEKNPGE